MHTIPQDAVLLIIDVQKGFDDPKWGRRNNLQAEDNIAKLLEAWRRSKRPIIHIQHLSREINSPLRTGYIGSGIKEMVKPLPDEPVIVKSVNSAFIGTDLEERLRKNNSSTLIITGLTTNHCVSTTTRMAGNLGFTPFVVSDATAAFDLMGHDGKLHKAEDVHMISLANLHREFATIIETGRVLNQFN
jgi:nicotinamidase-related amidase